LLETLGRLVADHDLTARGVMDPRLLYDPHSLTWTIMLLGVV
jgi:hypothetical protein